MAIAIDYSVIPKANWKDFRLNGNERFDPYSGRLGRITMRLFIITSEESSPLETEAVNELFHAGLDILHLRKPTCSKDTFEEMAAIN